MSSTREPFYCQASIYLEIIISVYSKVYALQGAHTLNFKCSPDYFLVDNICKHSHEMMQTLLQSISTPQLATIRLQEGCR